MAATLKCDTIQNASSATANLTLDASGNATVGGTVVPAHSFKRNVIINGGMRVDQRNAGASQTITAGAALAYTVDRWYAYCTGANVTGQQVANTGTTASPAQNAYQFTGAASVTAIGFGQRIEAVNSYNFANKTATLSVNLANSVLTTVTWTAYYANSTDAFGTLASPTVTQIATGTFTVTSTLTNYSTNISIPSAATTGIQIVFTVGAQTSGTWTIGNVQLETGSIATPYERQIYSEQLAQCQRYCVAFRQGVQGLYGSAFSESTTLIDGFVIFPVTMRTSPTGSYSAGNTFRFVPGSGSILTGTAISDVGNNPSNSTILLTVSGATANYPGKIQDQGAGTSYAIYSAEL